MTPVYPYALTINQLALYVRLGVSEHERSAAQTVHLDIRVYYPEALPSMDKDAATYDCYDVLAKRLQHYVDDKEFHLIEYLGPKLFAVIRDHVRPPAMIWLRITKLTVNPNIKGGASFVLSDVPHHAVCIPT